MEKYELELTEDNIKETIKNDYLDNNKKLYSLARLVKEIDKNMVICIDGEWGCGKTFFINQFKYIIKDSEKSEELKLDTNIISVLDEIKKNNMIVYYDAWKNDNHTDVFQSIIYNILNEFPNYKNIVTDFNEVKKMFLTIGGNIASICSLGVITNEIINFDKILTYEELAKDIVTIEEKSKNFKKLLKKILGNKRMILIIDELDRCNPMFASKVLETIKHFYDICNITVIIVANNKELSHTIKKQYGNEFNAYGYLNKFYDFIITLDNSKNKEYAEKVLDFDNRNYLPHEVCYEMFKKYNFSLRECNKFRILYNMVKSRIEINTRNFYDYKGYEICFYIILPIIIAFKIKDIDSYRECLNGQGIESLKSALQYINNDLDTWLKEIANTNEDNEIEIILDTYKKFRKNALYKEIFDDCVRMTL